jgi:hypothetical protein
MVEPRRCQQDVSSDPTRSLTSHHDAVCRSPVDQGCCSAEQGGGGLREGVRMAWHARGQGFKSPQLHPRSKARSGPCRLQIPTLWQQIGSNPCCLGRSGRPAKRQRRPASPPGTGHIRPPAASLAPATKHRIGRGTADRFKLVSDLILIRVLHPGLFLQDRSCDLHNDAPLETATNRSAPLDCGPNVDQTLARVRVRVRSVADACGAPVLRDQDRSAGRARQGRSLRRPSVAVDPPGFSGRASPRTWQRTRCR